jgi:hypothetical protein
MNLADRIVAVAEAAAAFPWLGEVTETKIRNWLALELEGLDEEPRKYGEHRSTPIRLSPILHIVSGNTPHAALQSLIRGILVGAENWIKIPGRGLPELERFCERLPGILRPEISGHLIPEWLERAEAVVVFGSDETIRQFQIAPHQRLLAHGHKISFGIIRYAFTPELFERATTDVFLFDQLGCLSPQSYYVAGDSKTFAALLAESFGRRARTLQEPIEKPNELLAATLRIHREEWKFRAATETEVDVWESAGSLDWTVIHARNPTLNQNPLYRTIFVHTLSDQLEDLSRPLRPYISTIGLDLVDRSGVNLALNLGAQRICRIGEMQNPPLTWHHDGWPPLASLVRFADIEGWINDETI